MNPVDIFVSVSTPEFVQQHFAELCRQRNHCDEVIQTLRGEILQRMNVPPDSGVHGLYDDAGKCRIAPAPTGRLITILQS